MHEERRWNYFRRKRALHAAEGHRELPPADILDDPR